MKTLRNKLIYIHLAAILFSAAIMCYMAFYNGYPLTFNNDTGVYIENGFSGYVAFDRPILYGLLIYYISLQRSLWWVVILQALITSLVTYYYFRYFSIKSNFLPYFIGFIIFVSFFMGASYNVSCIMPDIFTPLSLLCFGLLIFINKLKKRDLIIITFLAILSMGMHNSSFYICMGLTLLLFICFIIKPLKSICSSVGIQLKKIAFVFVLVVLSNIFLAYVHYMCYGGYRSSRGGVNFLMANMVEMGIIDTYLAENCDKKGYPICAYKDSLPNNFLWAENTPMNKTGGWEVCEDEYGAIVQDILTTPKYLKTFIYKSGVYTLKQFFNFDTGFSEKPSSRVERAIEDNYLNEYKVFTNSRQYTSHIGFGLICYLEYIAVALCLFMYCLILTFQKLTLRFRFFICFIITALFLNAWVCSTFSGIYPRYQDRIAWLLPLPLFLYLTARINFFLILRKLKGLVLNKLPHKTHKTFIL